MARLADVICTRAKRIQSPPIIMKAASADLRLALSTTATVTAENEAESYVFWHERYQRAAALTNKAVDGYRTAVDELGQALKTESKLKAELLDVRHAPLAGPQRSR